MKDATLTSSPAPLPDDIRTGDHAIDAYLAQINAGLIGSRAIRKATLAEARDFVLEASDGTPDRASGIRAAIAEFGSPDDIASAQRKERHAMFLKIALISGPSFALMMLLASLLGLPSPDSGWGIRTGVFAFNMLAFGLSMGAIFAYVIGGAPAPTVTTAADASRPGFTVAYRKSSRVLCWILIGVFGTMQVLLLLGLFDADPIGLFNTWPWPLTAFLLVLNLKNVGAPLQALRFRADVGTETVVIHRLQGPLRLHRRQIATVTTPGFARQAFSLMYGQQRKIGWRDDDDRLHHVTLSLTFDVTNGDRLIAWLEAAADDNRSR